MTGVGDASLDAQHDSLRRGSRRASIRFRVEAGEVCLDDRIAERYCQDVSAGVGDFLLRRADGIFAYQLAVVVDDIDMGVEQVVRGDDLLPSTPRQLLVYKALGARAPEFAHVPLVMGPGGQRLSKRHGAVAVRDFRQAGVSAARLVGALAASLGLAEAGQELLPRELVSVFDWARIRREPDVSLWPALSRELPS